MGMLATVVGNLLRPARSRAPTDLPAVPAPYRGLIRHDVARCTGCGACAHVCAPSAISLSDEPGVAITWRFDAGRCSFCGLCGQHCPTGAIADSDGVAPGLFAPERHVVADRVPYVACGGCGAAHVPMPRVVLAERGETDIDPAHCPDCRRRAFSDRMRRAALALARGQRGNTELRP
jgi:hydrogenase-4 component H